MLQLRNIVKTYVTGDVTQHALNGVSVSFRENEFVSILGPSGSGKTTLLNIIGGLDRYSSGDLIINGTSTRSYRDGDWDFYRNHSIGFVFQSYNLIPHQSVLSNVELALTLAGVSKKERRERAIRVLRQVGLEEHIHKKPNQMSGGQMQRVAIARALINNPDILLADEPTGALDSETSLQIMELLKEIARDKLVIMVTHNPELAEQYSTRIVKLRDGRVTDDTDPYDAEQDVAAPQKRRHISMSFWTALSLSFHNLRTKKGRTLLTAFAGSIGIIGIALILSISTGIQDYVNSIQRDTLSSYPISITREDNTLLSGLMNAQGEQIDFEAPEEHDDDAVYSSAGMYRMFNAVFAADEEENNLTAFKAWLDQEMDPQTATTALAQYVSTIQYQYDISLNTYVRLSDGSYRSTALDQALELGSSQGTENAMSTMLASRLSMMDTWSELLPGTDGALISELLYEQYDLVAGQWPTQANELVLILDANNEASDISFYTLGLMTQEEVNDMFLAAVRGEEVLSEQKKVSFDDALGTTFRLVLNAEYYSKGTDGQWRDIREDEAALKLAVENGYELKLVGILRPNPEASAASITSTFAYTSALTDYVLEKTAQCEIVQEQLLPENENYDVLTGLPFVLTDNLDPSDSEKAGLIREYFSSLTSSQKAGLYTQILGTPTEEYLTGTVATLMEQYPTRESMLALAVNTYGFDPAAAESYFSEYSDDELRELLAEQLRKLVCQRYLEQAETQVAQLKAAASTPDDLFGVQGELAVAQSFDQMVAATEDEATLAAWYDAYMPNTVSGSTLSDTLLTLGSLRPDTPETVNLYASSFEDKEEIDSLIAQYNDEASEEDQITYTDYVALLMSGVTAMIDAVSYGLIGFVSISLVVSSIMIGIITYISVLERTKEIGILRSVGASKRDISRVFNAETILVGLAAGLIGIGVTLLLNIPIRILAKNLTGIPDLAILPPEAAVILVIISVVLTMIAGLIPARVAAKKDPVVALRTE